MLFQRKAVKKSTDFIRVKEEINLDDPVIDDNEIKKLKMTPLDSNEVKTYPIKVKTEKQAEKLNTLNENQEVADIPLAVLPKSVPVHKDNHLNLTSTNVSGKSTRSSPTVIQEYCKKQKMTASTDLTPYQFSNTSYNEISDSDSEKILTKSTDYKKPKQKEHENNKQATSFDSKIQKIMPNIQMVKEVDVLNQQTLQSHLAEKITEMYGKSSYETDVKTVDLFQRDLMNQEKIDGMTIGDPFTYQTIKIMMGYKKTEYVSSSTMQHQMIDICNIPFGDFDDDEEQLSTAIGNERNCVNDKNCLSNIWFGVILREYIRPTEKKSYEEGIRNEYVNPCLMCLRKACEILQSLYLSSNKAPPDEYIFQPVRNSVNEIGQYHLSDCLQVGYGILYPVAQNFKEKYLVEHPKTHGARTYIKQYGYRRFTEEDLKSRNF